MQHVHVASRRHDEWATLHRQIEEMLEGAEAAYQDAAARHFMGEASHHGGRIAALKAVLALMDE